MVGNCFAQVSSYNAFSFSLLPHTDPQSLSINIQKKEEDKCKKNVSMKSISTLGKDQSTDELEWGEYTDTDQDEKSSDSGNSN